MKDALAEIPEIGLIQPDGIGGEGSTTVDVHENPAISGINQAAGYAHA